MNKLLFFIIFCCLILLSISFYSLEKSYISNIYHQISFNKNLIEYNKQLRETILTKPNYNEQGSLLILPNGSGYIPVLFADKPTLEKYKTEQGWNKFPQGYYDLNKIYVIGENKKHNKIK